MKQLIALAIVNALISGTFLLFFGIIPPEVPLYYAHSWGAAQIVNKWELLVVPLALMNTFHIVLIQFHRALKTYHHPRLQLILQIVNSVQIALILCAYTRILLLIIL